MASDPRDNASSYVTIPVRRFPQSMPAAGGNNGQGTLGVGHAAATAAVLAGTGMLVANGGNTIIVGPGVSVTPAGNGGGAVIAWNGGGATTIGNGGVVAAGNDDNEDSGDESDDDSESGARVTNTTDKPFRFNDLPTEIRCAVYRICLKRDRHIIIRNKHVRSKTVHIRHNEDVTATHPQASRAFQAAAPLTPVILRVSKKIYEEARAILYGENKFHLDVLGSIDVLARLHQRSRRFITNVELEIPTTDVDVLDRFAKVVRLSLRYFAELKKLVIYLPIQNPNQHNGNALQLTLGTAPIWESMRWLPEGCVVYLEGQSGPKLEWVLQKYVKLGNPKHVVSGFCVSFSTGTSRKSGGIWSIPAVNLTDFYSNRATRPKAMRCASSTPFLSPAEDCVGLL